MSLTSRSENRGEVKAPVLSPNKTRGKLVSFRLSDVPLGVRLRAVEPLIQNTKNPVASFDLGMAAHCPSETVYWIPQRAWNRMVSSAAKQSRKPKAETGEDGEVRQAA